MESQPITLEQTNQWFNKQPHAYRMKLNSQIDMVCLGGSLREPKFGEVRDGQAADAKIGEEMSHDIKPSASSRTAAVAWARSHRQAGDGFESIIARLVESGWSNREARLIAVGTLDKHVKLDSVSSGNSEVPTIDYASPKPVRHEVSHGWYWPDLSASNKLLMCVGVILTVIGAVSITELFTTPTYSNVRVVNPNQQEDRGIRTSLPEDRSDELGSVAPLCFGSVAFPVGLGMCLAAFVESRKNR